MRECTLISIRNGSGAGSYNIHWTIWHVNHGNPEINTSGYGWQIFNAILGWNNTGTYATTLTYIFYWVAVSAALVYMRFKEEHPNSKWSNILSRKARKGSHASSGSEKGSFSDIPTSGHSKKQVAPVVYEVGASDVPEVK